MSLLEMTGVVKRYGHQTILRDVCLAVSDGEVVHLAGANGAGKTTLLRLAAGIARPTAGTVQLAGASPLDPAARRGIGYVGQTSPMYRELSPREHVAWWRRLHGLGDAPGETNEALQAAGLQAAQDRPARHLSGGQRKRLSIVMATTAQPPLLLLDEPFAGLDAEGRDWLHGLLAAPDQAALIVEHDHRIKADRALLLEAGRVRQT